MVAAVAQSFGPGTACRGLFHCGFCDLRHSPRMLAALMIGPHNAASARTLAPSSAGVELATASPSGSNFVLTDESPSIVTTSACIFCTIGSGVFPGTNRPYHHIASYPGTASAMLGSSGAFSNGCPDVTPSPR